ncbi:DedA family protein [Micromonospora sp. NPDC000207]|uniref:DedA family protein n=1 Tax=Micromonospora sp. NPDC000207 TaxID=3154246 RepID=UPI00331E54C0
MTEWSAQLGELPTALVMVALGLVMVLDAVPLLGVLVPGDVAVLAAIGLGRPGIAPATVGSVVIGCVCGWSLTFAAGRRYGKRLRHGRFGGWIGESRWAAAEMFVRRGGGRMVLVTPFLPVFNTLVPLAAGGLRMSYWRFLGCSALGAGLWAGLYVLLGSAARWVTGLFPGGPAPTLVTMAVGMLLAGTLLAGTRRRLLSVVSAPTAVASSTATPAVVTPPVVVPSAVAPVVVVPRVPRAAPVSATDSAAGSPTGPEAAD